MVPQVVLEKDSWLSSLIPRSSNIDVFMSQVWATNPRLLHETTQQSIFLENL